MLGGYDRCPVVATKVYHTFTIALQTSPRTASTTREGVTTSREGYQGRGGGRGERIGEARYSRAKSPLNSRRRRGKFNLRYAGEARQRKTRSP